MIGGMLAGADSIDDSDVLRQGGMGKLFAGVRARAGTADAGHVHAWSGAAARRGEPDPATEAGLAEHCPGLLAG